MTEEHDEVIVALAEASGMGDPGDFELEGTAYLGDGTRYSGPGMSEWAVYSDHDEAEDAAIEYVTQMLEDEPELFTQSWLAPYISVDDAHTIAHEEADAYWEDLSDEEVLEMADGAQAAWDAYDYKYDEAQERIEEIEKEVWNLSEPGSDEEAVLHEEVNDLEAQQGRWQDEQAMVIEKFREEGKYEYGEEVKDRIEKDPLGWLEDMGYTPEEALKLRFVSIDVDTAATDAINTDGVPHFLSNYDGDEVDLGESGVAYRTG